MSKCDCKTQTGRKLCIYIDWGKTSFDYSFVTDINIKEGRGKESGNDLLALTIQM